jgi:hypothetical protein
MLHLKMEEIMIINLVPKLTGGPVMGIVLIKSKSTQVFRLIYLLNPFGGHKIEMPEVPGG